MDMECLRMKLNYRRTLLIGFVFLSISTFWQMYDYIVPLILQGTFHIGHTESGMIMAMDNIFALFMLPIFGRLSDRCNTPLGRRMPFILFGSCAAITLLIILMGFNRPGMAVQFILVLGLTLLAMGTYRSPAVALMPDITPSPLRSKANSIINLMGSLGGVYALYVITRIAPSTASDYMSVAIAVACIMAFAVLLVLLFVRENKLRAQMPPEPETEVSSSSAIPPEMRSSLLRILLSVAFWYMGYNAISSAFSKFYLDLTSDLSGMNVPAASTILMAMQISSIASYIPIGILSSKFGRKKMNLAATAILVICFGSVFFLRTASALNMYYVVFVLIGAAWAVIHVNSYPMVVEISSGADIGKYTGYYYVFSMAAQTLTPILSGWFIDVIGFNALFPYASIMTAVAFFTMVGVKHGDVRPERVKSLLEHFNSDD